MKILVQKFCLAFLLGALGIQASVWGGSASATAATLNAATTAELNQDQPVTPPDGDLPFRFDHISTEHGLSSSDVWSVLRDHHGFMWFGTLDGLNRYDGYEMIIFKHSLADPTSLSDNRIRTLYEDKEGALWIGTWSGGLNRFERKTETFTRFQNDPADPDSLSNDSVNVILEDQAGRLWLGTRGGLNRFDPAAGVFRRYQHAPDDAASLGNDNVFALAEDSDGMLWVGTDGGLDRFDSELETFRHYRHDADDPASLSNDVIRSLFIDSSGTLWVGTWSGGLNRFDRTDETFSHYQNDPNDAHSLSNDDVGPIQQDATGALWIGTLSGGVNRLDPQTGTFWRFGADYVNPWGFGATQAFDMAEGAGLLWFATGSGVFTLDLQPKPFRTFQHDPDDVNSLAANEIDAIYEDPQGVLWVTTSGAGLNRIDRLTGKVSRFQDNPSDPTSSNANDIWAIAPSRDGTLWLATFGNGLGKFDPETGKSVYYRHDADNAASIGSDITTAVLEDQSGMVWVGTWDAGLDRFDPATGAFSHFEHNPVDSTSLSENVIITLVEDHNGELWIGTFNNGLNRFNRATESFTRYKGEVGKPQSLPSNGVTSVLLDRAGSLWVGTWGGGLARLNPDTGEFTHYDHSSGLPSDAVFSILEDGQGRLWLSTSNGLSRFDPRSETFRNYDERDGLPGNVFEVATAFQSSGGEMFFGSATNGLLAFYPDQIHDNPVVPPVIITDLLLENKPVPIGEDSVLQQAIDETDALTLSYLDRVISFEFAALNYSSPQKNRYRYRLEGFDRTWTEVGSDRRLVTYTNLDPGDYVFRVTGSNNDGVWNVAGTSLALTITPPWWETTWFSLSTVLLIMGLITGGFVWQQRRAEFQQRRLEAMVVERTRELHDAQAQISTLFDNSPLGICLATVEGEILGTNRAMQRISGYSEDELLQQNASVLYANPEQRAQLLDHVIKVGNLSNYGIQLQRRDGSHYFASVNMSRLEMAGQDVILGIVDDITQQVKTSEALTTLHQISYDLVSTTDLQTLLDHALQQLYEIVDFQRAALMLVEDGEESLTIYVYTSPVSPPDLADIQLLVNDWPVLEAALNGQGTAYIPDILDNQAAQTEMNGVQIEAWAAALKASRSWLGLPLRVGERSIGVLNLLHDDVNCYAEGDINLSRTFANQFAVAIDDIRLNEQTKRNAAAEERARIARELHDSVTQTLFTASMIAESTPLIWNKDQNLGRQNMDKLGLLMRGALAEMRSLLLELRADKMPNQTLGQLFTVLADAAQARSNMTVSINIEDDCEPPPEVAMTFYRITQEAMNNVIKHAEATKVDITLITKSVQGEHSERRQAALHIRDDGRGFDPQVIPAEHMGLKIMAERVQEIGGDLQIHSKPGHGAEVTVTWTDAETDPQGKTSHD